MVWNFTLHTCTITIFSLHNAGRLCEAAGETIFVRLPRILRGLPRGADSNKNSEPSVSLEIIGMRIRNGRAVRSDLRWGKPEGAWNWSGNKEASTWNRGNRGGNLPGNVQREVTACFVWIHSWYMWLMHAIDVFDSLAGISLLHILANILIIC